MNDGLRVALHHFRRLSVRQEVAATYKERSLAEVLDKAHRVGDQDDGDALGLKLPHLGQALLLEAGVAHGQHFVDEEDLRVAVHRDGKAEAYVHAGGVALDGGVNEVPQLSEGDNLVEAGADLLAGHAQDGGVEEDVLAAGEVWVKAGAQLDKR